MDAEEGQRYYMSTTCYHRNWETNEHVSPSHSCARKGILTKYKQYYFHPYALHRTQNRREEVYVVSYKLLVNPYPANVENMVSS